MATGDQDSDTEKFTSVTGSFKYVHVRTYKVCHKYMNTHGGLSTSTTFRLRGGGEAFTTISCKGGGCRLRSKFKPHPLPRCKGAGGGSEAMPSDRPAHFTCLANLQRLAHFPFGLRRLDRVVPTHRATLGTVERSVTAEEKETYRQQLSST